MGRWPATQAIFWKNGAPLRAGERLVQKDLATFAAPDRPERGQGVLRR